MKKFLALALALTMALALSVSAMAADTTPTTTQSSNSAAVNQQTSSADITVTVETLLYLPSCKISIGNQTSVVMYPYKLQVTHTELNISANTDTLYSAPVLITNESDLGIKVTAKPTASPAGKLVLVTSPVADDATVPTAFLALELRNETSATPATTGWTAVDSITTGTTIAVMTSGGTDTASIDLAAGNTAPTYGSFNFIGECGGPGWGENDTVQISVVFSFEAIIPTT